MYRDVTPVIETIAMRCAMRARKCMRWRAQDGVIVSKESERPATRFVDSLHQGWIEAVGTGDAVGGKIAGEIGAWLLRAIALQ